MVWATFHAASDHFLIKFSLLNYDLNTDYMIRLQKVCTTFETVWKISKNFQFHLYRPSTRLPDYYNWRCHEKKRKLKLLRTWSNMQVVIFWLHLEKVNFKLENVIFGMTLKIHKVLLLRTWEFCCWIRRKVQNTVSREKDEVITTFCSINCEFLFFMLLSTIMMQYL